VVAGSTYLDRAITAVAAAGANAATGRADEAEAVLAEALTECLRVGDVVAIALLQRTFARVLGREHVSGAGQLGALGAGWLRVIESLPALEHVS
jgi:hypothetical protein